MKISTIQLMLVIGCIYLYPKYSEAACTTPNHTAHNSIIPNKVYHIQYDDNSNKTLDTIVLKAHNGVTGSLLGSRCNLQFELAYSAFWATKYTGEGILPTNIPGIYLKITIPQLSKGIPFIPGISPAPGQQYSYIGVDNWSVQIIKKGQISVSGSIDSGMIAYYDIFANINPSIRSRISNLYINNKSININLIGCSLKKSVYEINLGDWTDKKFKEFGDTSENVNIPITLNCLPGTNIKVSVSADVTDNAANGRLALTGTNKATGIAIQLLNNAGNPIPINTQWTQQDNVPKENYIFGWKARYFRTMAPLSPGTANASATVNILYE